jgi:hypothetical protein
MTAKQICREVSDVSKDQDTECKTSNGDGTDADDC